MINPEPLHRSKTPYRTPSQLKAGGRILTPRVKVQAISPVWSRWLSGLKSKPKTASLRHKPTNPGEGKHPHTWVRRLSFLAVGVVVFGLTFVLAEYFALKGNVIVQGGGESRNLLEATSLAQLNADQFKQAGDGRFNLLILGVGGVDDQGVAHEGTFLTDSIQVLSVDTINKKQGIISLPRDFYFETNHLPGKLNAVYSQAEALKAGSGGLAAREAVGQILQLNISNFVLCDFSATEKLITALGGVEVNPPKALYDGEYPDGKGGTTVFSVKAGKQTLNGAKALMYMRTRHADSDYGRSGRQQEVLQSLKSKALSLGVLGNPVKISELISILGQHVKTDLDVSGLKALISIIKDIDASQSTSAVLDNSSQLGLLDDGLKAGVGYVSYPVSGLTDYAQIASWFQRSNPDPYILGEAVTINVVNGGSTRTGFISFQNQLKDYHFNLQVSLESESSRKLILRVPDRSRYPVSVRYLEHLLGVKAVQEPVKHGDYPIEIIYQPISQ